MRLIRWAKQTLTAHDSQQGYISLTTWRCSQSEPSSTWKGWKQRSWRILPRSENDGILSRWTLCRHTPRLYASTCPPRGLRHQNGYVLRTSGFCTELFSPLSHLQWNNFKTVCLSISQADLIVTTELHAFVSDDLYPNLMNLKFKIEVSCLSVAGFTD